VKDIREKWALITGASSGFGIEFAKILAARRANVILAARRTEEMQKLASELEQRYAVKTVVEGIDLARSGAGKDLKARLDQRGVAVDILVNNAGFGLYGNFLDLPLEKTLEMIQLNVETLTELTYVFARDMVERRSGRILLVSSALGFQAAPGYASYGGTKGYVLLFGEALHEELKPQGVSVTCLCPGFSSTSFSKVAGARTSPLLRLLTMKPRPVAEIGVRAMLRGQAIAVPGLVNKFAVYSDRIMPRKVQRSLMQKIFTL
jgi:short-subunit dehydrogenase